MTRSRRRGSPAPALAIAAALATLVLASCDPGPTVVRGAAVSTYLAAVFVEDVEGQLLPTEPPAPGAGPAVTVPTNADGITGGSTALDLAGTAPFRTVAVFVPGADGHYLVTLPGDLTTAISVITISGLVPTADFQVQYAVAGVDGEWGPRQAMDVHAITAAGGDIQVSVTWNTEADVDLHVVDPGGSEIYYGSRTSASGGELDIDANAACSTSNLRQENVGWKSGTAPSGTYHVRVDYWSSCGATQTDYIVTVNLRPGTPTIPGLPGKGVQIFTGSFTGEGTGGGAGDGRPITSFFF